MAEEHEIHHRESGSLGEHDEYWTLIVPADGTAPSVRYEASWGNPYRGKVDHPPPKVVPLKSFLSEHRFGTIHDKLRDLLRRLGIDPNA
jgi:hypothetical protein